MSVQEPQTNPDVFIATGLYIPGNAVRDTSGLIDVRSFLGFFNGLMITILKIPPFVATLAMLTIAEAVPGSFQASLTLYETGGKELKYVDDVSKIRRARPNWLFAG